MSSCLVLPPEIVMHDDAYISDDMCMPISGARTKQLNIIAGFLLRHWFTSDFLNFIVVEPIRFFHGAIHLAAKATVATAYVKHYVSCFSIFNICFLLLYICIQKTCKYEAICSVD